MIARVFNLFRKPDPFAKAMKAFDAERDEARRRHRPTRDIEARRRAFVHHWLAGAQA